MRGLAYDSLGNSPLVGAFIGTDVDGATTTTGLLKRFMVSVSRRIARLRAFHDVPDRLGLGALVVYRPPGATR